LLRQDLNAALEREEGDAIALEREAFRRYQAAMAAMNGHVVPSRDPVPTLRVTSASAAAAQACNAAHDAWVTAKAAVDRMLAELRSGQRR
jgi:hypothetical protein